MITILWLLVWLLCGTPNVEVFDETNTWGLALVVCIIIDLLK